MKSLYSIVSTPIVRIRYALLLLFVISMSSLWGQSEPLDMRVITYNIWNGFDWGKDSSRHQQFMDWVNFQKPDVFALQELCGYTQEKLAADAKAWGHDHAMILKEDGYPVGLTSKWPITLVKKQREGMWHGMLHVKTNGIDFFVVHLSPADWATRHREAQIITQQINELERENYLVLGDFNAHSPMDADLDRSRQALLARYQRGDANNEQYENLRNHYWDYSVMSTFFGQGLLDLTVPYVSLEERFSFPAPALENVWQTASEIKRNRHRIDFILASPSLSNHCIYSRILNGAETERLSDHFPVIADFIFR